MSFISNFVHHWAIQNRFSLHLFITFLSYGSSKPLTILTPDRMQAQKFLQQFLNNIDNMC